MIIMIGVVCGILYYDDVSVDREQDGYGVNCDKVLVIGFQMDVLDMVVGVVQFVDEELKGLMDQGDVDWEEELDKDINWIFENEYDNCWKIEVNGNGSWDSDNFSVGKVMVFIS